MTNLLLTHALNYAALGWPVVPLCWLRCIGRNAFVCVCQDRDQCRRPGKHPFRAAVPHGLRDASRDSRMIEAWWRQFPRANIGLICGRPGGRWVLDVDGVVGASTLERLEAVHGPLPRTLEGRTGSGGRHLIFQWPDRKVVTRQGHPGEGLDVRGDGGYIVAPPSSHVSGGTYSWIDSHVPTRIGPAWLLELVMEAPAPLPASHLHREVSWDYARRVARARGYARAYPGAISGERGHLITFTLSVHLVRGFGLSADDALSVLVEEHNSKCQPPWSAREIRHKVDDATRSKEPMGYLLARGNR